VHLSPDYFSHLLDISTGKTAKQYLQALRMNKAMGLLVQTKLSVETVAEQVGYRGSNFFSSLFSRTVGMSPSDYRALFS
jgi:two-component system response regulator YesN